MKSKKNKIYIKYKIFYRSIVVIEILNKTNIKQKITSMKYILAGKVIIICIYHYHYHISFTVFITYFYKILGISIL